MTEDIGLHYRIPGHNQVALTEQLAQRLQTFVAKDRENRFQLCLLAGGIRNAYLDKKTKKYTDEFSRWYKKNKLDGLFGSLANFTKYALSGEVIAYVATKTSDPEKYLKQLPSSVGALYEIAAVDTESGKKILGDHETAILCLNHRPSRTSRSQPKHEWGYAAGKTVIHQHATEAEIHQWKRNWFNPPPPKPKRRLDDRVLVLATIKVNGALFDFDKKTGDKVGVVDLPEVEALMDAIQKLFTASNQKQFLFESQLEHLSEGYYSRKDKADPARKIIDAAAAKKKPKRKPLKG